MTPRKAWSFAAGKKGRPHRVKVMENPQRDWTLLLRWTESTPDGPRLKAESLGRDLL